jgi:membrane protease YdiL (CAAX protease family)
MTPTMAERREPAWGYEDLVLFVSAVLPSLALAALGLRLSRVIAPGLFSSDAATTLVFQSFMYVFLTAALYLVISWRYGAPFWRALAWTFPVPRALQVLVAGPVLTIVLSSLGVALRTPPESSQIENMINSRASLAIVMLFGVVLAPIFEELVFRGFLFPLLARSFGPWPGIVLTTIPFALLHGAQNRWAWQPIILIGIAGAVFGFVRYKTESTTSSFLLHASYNLTGFVGYALTHWGTLT